MIISLKSVKLVRHFFSLPLPPSRDGSTNEINNSNGNDPRFDGSKCENVPYDKCP